LGYRLRQAGFAVTVDWIGPTAHTAEQLLAMPSTSEELSELDEAKAAILDLVVNGPIAAEQAMKGMKRRGIAERTWKRAKVALRVLSRKESFSGAWSWYPPEECQEDEECQRSGDGTLRPDGTLRGGTEASEPPIIPELKPRRRVRL